LTSAPSEETLARQYDRALEEYRFQVDLNWRRSEYFFVLNVGVLIASATMFSSEDVPRVLVAALFLVGVLLAGLSFLANDVQHRYYRSARKRKRELEERLDLEDLALVTTPGMGSGIERLGRVGTFLKIMLIAIAAADLLGAGFAIAAEIEGATTRPPAALIRLEPSRGESSAEGVVMVSQDGKPIDSQRLGSQRRMAAFSLDPGLYLVSALGSRLSCKAEVRVTEKPLQMLPVPCRNGHK